MGEIVLDENKKNGLDNTDTGAGEILSPSDAAAMMEVSTDDLPSNKGKRLFSFHVSVDDFMPASQSERQQLAKMRESNTYFKDAMRRFRSNKMAMISFFVLVVIVLFAVIVPMVSPYQYDQQIRGHERMAPGAEHWFGTDNLGRDMFVRVMVGTRISLLVGLVASVLETVIGGIYGSVAGYMGGRTDTIMMRIADVIYALPDVLIIILLSMVLSTPIDNFAVKAGWDGLRRLGAPLISIFITFSLLYWVGMARMVRSQILQLKQMEYVTVARAFGAKGPRIVRKHLLPNASSSVLVQAMFQIPSAIFTESFLSFIGLGVRAPMASLGSLASEALQGLTSYPYLMIEPAVMIAVIMLALNQFGDGLRDALDPKIRD